MLLTPESRLPPAEGWSEARCQGRWGLESFRRLWGVSEAVSAQGDNAADDVPGQRFVEADVAVRSDAAGVWRLQGTTRAALGAICQRCLDPVALEVVSEMDVPLACASGSTVAHTGEQDELAEWPAEGMTLGELLEDEIFLAMPQVPVHRDAQDCGKLAQRLEESSETGAADSPSGRDEAHPFAGLRDLLSDAAADRDKND